MTKVNYINNKDLLAEIHLSKNTYSVFTDNCYRNYDNIVDSVEILTPEYIQEVYDRKVEQISKRGPVPWPVAFSRSSNIEDLVFRVMTEEHVPDDPEGKKRKRGNKMTTTMRTCFPPFKHYIIDNGIPIEVGRSHWKGTFVDGEFNGTHGRISNGLANMFMLLVQRISLRGNWRGYSYVDEMRCNALVQLSQVALQFDESRSHNPFSFYTQIIKHCFTRVLNLEKQNQNIRDDLLEACGAAPSNSRQVDHEFDVRYEEHRIVAEEQRAEFGLTAPEPVSILQPKKRGRKPKSESQQD